MDIKVMGECWENFNGDVDFHTIHQFIAISNGRKGHCDPKNPKADRCLFSDLAKISHSSTNIISMPQLRV